MSEKTHQPSERKLRDARKQGQFARSKALSSAGATVGGVVVTLLFAQPSVARLVSLTQSVLSLESLTLSTTLTRGVTTFALCLAPTVVGSFMGALAPSVMMAGLELTPLSPALDRLNFVTGFGKLFSARQALDVAKSLAIAALLGWLVWRDVRAAGPDAFRLLQHDGVSAALGVGHLLASTLQTLCAALLVYGAVDYALARRRHRKDHMMSLEDVKQEHKSSEGDPHHKSKRKAEHKKLANGGPARGVQKATAVVVNPTHIAVAIRYADGECDAPYIVAKAREDDALALREEAKTQGIPIVRDIPLARALIHYDVGEEVPEELYQAAAAVLKVALNATTRLPPETSKEPR